MGIAGVSKQRFLLTLHSTASINPLKENRIPISSAKVILILHSPLRIGQCFNCRLPHFIGHFVSLAFIQRRLSAVNPHCFDTFRLQCRSSEMHFSSKGKVLEGTAGPILDHKQSGSKTFDQFSFQSFYQPRSKLSTNTVHFTAYLMVQKFDFIVPQWQLEAIC